MNYQAFMRVAGHDGKDTLAKNPVFMRVSRVFVSKPHIEPNIPKMVVGFFVARIFLRH